MLTVQSTEHLPPSVTAYVRQESKSMPLLPTDPLKKKEEFLQSMDCASLRQAGFFYFTQAFTSAGRINSKQSKRH
jgi:hypothetical protein